MDSRTQRLASKHALSLTTIASKLAQWTDYFRVTVPFIIEMWPGNEQKKP
jgi:hypothetical protein